MEQLEPDRISDAGLQPGEFLAIHIGESYSRKSIKNDQIRTKNSEFWFFQVADRVKLRYQPFELRDDQGNAVGQIADDSGVNYQRLFNANGEDILQIDDDAWRVYHFSLGVQQDGVRIYPRIPDNQNGGGFEWLSGNEPDPTQGPPYGYISSNNSDVDDPTIELETVAWQGGTRSVHQYGFYNNSGGGVTPTLSIVGWAYDLRPVNAQADMLNLLADIEKVDRTTENAIRLVDFSPSTLRTFSFNVPEAWRDTENNLQVAEANLPGNIRSAIAEARSGPEDEQAVDVEEIR